MPEIKKVVKNYSCKHQPWITSGITNSIRHTNNLYETYLRNKSICSYNKYNKYKNKLTNTIKAAEKMYYHGKFEMKKYNIGKTSKLIKSIINKNKFYWSNQRIKINNNLTTDKQIIADSFNDYFLNVGPNLANNMSSS